MSSGPNYKILSIAALMTAALALTFGQIPPEHDHALEDAQTTTGAPASTTTDGSHAHDHAADSDSTGGGHVMVMQMWFTARMTGPLLFSFLDVTSRVNYGLFCLGLAIACALREYLATYRLELERENNELQLLHAAASQALHSADGSISIRLETHRKCLGTLSGPLLSSLLHGANMCLAYCIMLVVMSYDGIFFAVIISASIAAHFYFQHQRPATHKARTTPANAFAASAANSQSAADDRRQSLPAINLNARMSPTMFQRRESGDDEEHERLTPAVHTTSSSSNSAMRGFTSPYAGPGSASKKAALQMAIQKDCCES